jgi:phage terminase large subunit-like protein
MSPSAAILDELHEHLSPALRDAMLQGMGARRQPLLIQITTAGNDMAGVCYEVRDEAIKVLKGKKNGERKKDSLFSMIYTLDPGDDPLTEASQIKANPNFGVSVYAEGLRRALRDAINNPAAYFVYCTKRLNLWGSSKSGYFNMAAWAKSGDAPPLSTWHRKPVYEGLDLAARVDLASRVKVFTELRKDGVHYFIYGTHYVPSDTAGDGRHADYARWVREGWLTAHGGAEIQLSRVQADIAGELDQYNHQCLAFDQAFAMQMQQELEQITKPGVVITIPQTARMLSEPMKELKAALVAGRVHHTGDPVLTWCISNVTSRPDKNENEFPDKDRPESKIDAATALLNAMNRVVAAREINTITYRGLRSV